VRASSPVDGSSLNTNPPDDVPNGAVAISVAVATAIESPDIPLVPWFANCSRTCFPVRSGTVVTFCAIAGDAYAIVRIAVAIRPWRLRLVFIKRPRRREGEATAIIQRDKGQVKTIEHEVLISFAILLRNFDRGGRKYL